MAKRPPSRNVAESIGGVEGRDRRRAALRDGVSRARGRRYFSSAPDASDAVERFRRPRDSMVRYEYRHQRTSAGGRGNPQAERRTRTKSAGPNRPAADRESGTGSVHLLGFARLAGAVAPYQRVLQDSVG